MKSYGQWLVPVFGMLLLSGCASLSPKSVDANTFQQNLSPDAQAKLNSVLNTATDGTPVSWQSDDNDMTYDVTTRSTRVNAQGQPCRDYVLVVKQDYHRTQQTSSEVCRDANGQWQVSY